MILKKIQLAKREYAMIFTCVGFLLALPIYTLIENPVSNVSYPYSLLIGPALILIGYGWLMPLWLLLAWLVTASSVGGSILTSISSEPYILLPILIPIISTVIIVKFSAGIPPWRTILYAHIIASAIGMFAITSFWPNLFS